MNRWRCPACDREFARTAQSHVCLPGNSVDQTFAGHPPVQREIYDAIVGHLRTLGPVYVDAVRVGIFLSHVSKMAEVRPMTRWVRLHLFTPRYLDDERIRRRERISASRFWYVLNLTVVSDVDDQLRNWLSEAYDSAG